MSTASIRRSVRRRLRLDRSLWALVILASLLLLACSWTVSDRALSIFQRELVPSFDRDGETVGRAVAAEMQRALDLHIPLDRLEGVPDFLATYLRRRESLAYIALAKPSGETLAAEGRDVAKIKSALARGGVRMQPDAPVITPLAGVRNTSLPLLSNGLPVAYLHVGVDDTKVQAQIADVRWDVWVLLLVAILTAFELLLLLLDRSIAGPVASLRRIAERAQRGDWTVKVAVSQQDEVGMLLHASNALVQRVNNAWMRLRWKVEEIGRHDTAAGERGQGLLRSLATRFHFAPNNALRQQQQEARAGVARAALFIFIFAEQLSMSFMPLYAKSLERGPLQIGEGFLLGLPLIAFVGTIALATPLAGGFARTLGNRRIFLLGAIPAVAGYVGASLAATVLDLVLARIVCGIGYAMITIACQGYLSEIARGPRQTRDMSVFVLAVMTGTICGAAIGSVIADRVGYRTTFLVSAALVLAAAAITAALMPRLANAQPVAIAPHAGGLRIAFSNPRFAGLVLLAALPAKLILNGFLYYLVPIYLASLALTQPEIGRVVMMYGITMLPSIWIGARIADRFGHLNMQIGVSGMLTGLAGAAILLLPPAPSVLVAVIVLGLAQGIGSGPLLAAVPRIAAPQSQQIGLQKLLGYVRSFERIGSVLGPPVAASLALVAGYAGAIVWLSATVAAAGLLYLVADRLLQARTA